MFKCKNQNKFFVSVTDDEKILNFEEKRFVEDPANADLFHDVASPLEAPQSGTKRTAEEASSRSSKKNKTEICEKDEVSQYSCIVVTSVVFTSEPSMSANSKKGNI